MKYLYRFIRRLRISVNVFIKMYNEKKIIKSLQKDGIYSIEIKNKEGEIIEAIYLHDNSDYMSIYTSGTAKKSQEKCYLNEIKYLLLAF